MKFINKFTVATIASLMISPIITTNVINSNVEASTYSVKRNKSVKLAWRKSMKRHAYHTVKGSRYSAHLGTNYGKMSKYPHTTWYTNKHEKLIVKKNKRARIYYHIVSSNHKHAGWIWKGYLIAGINPAAKKTTTNKTTTNKTQHPATTTNTPTKALPVRNQSTAEPAKKAPNLPQLSVPTIDSKGQSSSLIVTQNPDGTVNNFDGSDNVIIDKAIIKNAFIAAVNRDRAVHNRSSLHDDSDLDKIAEQRSQQIVTNFSHYDAAGNVIVTGLVEKAGINNGNYGAEEIAEGDFVDSNVTKTADNILNAYKDGKGDAAFDDSSTHYYDLVNSSDTDKLGVGITYDNHGTLYICVDLGFKA